RDFHLRLRDVAVVEVEMNVPFDLVVAEEGRTTIGAHEETVESTVRATPPFVHPDPLVVPRREENAGLASAPSPKSYTKIHPRLAVPGAIGSNLVVGVGWVHRAELPRILEGAERRGDAVHQFPVADDGRIRRRGDAPEFVEHEVDRRSANP